MKIKNGKSQTLGKKVKKMWQLPLNVQFTVVVLLSILLSFAVLIGTLSVLSPVLSNKVAPWIDKISEDFVAMENDLKVFDGREDLLIKADGSIPEIETWIKGYPDYTISYEFIQAPTEAELLVTVGAKASSRDSMQQIQITLPDGIVLVDIRMPEAEFWSAMVILSSVLLFIIVLLLLIILFVSRKSRYIKSISAKLEVIAGGDLTTLVPVKGHDEMTLLANHINMMTKALKEQFDKEKQVEEIKQQLIANISHDLRTPLTAVIGYLSLLAENKETPLAQQSQWINQALSKSQNVSHLVDQLFDYVLLAQHHNTLNLVSVEPSLFYYQLIDEYESILLESDMTVHYELEQSVGKSLVDISYFQRLIGNLLMNCKKYGLPREVINVIGINEQKGYRIEITNKTVLDIESQGIQVEFLDRYFTTDRISGKSAGLGLAICKEIVEQHGGELEIERKADCFTAIIKIGCE